MCSCVFLHLWHAVFCTHGAWALFLISLRFRSLLVLVVASSMTSPVFSSALFISPSHPSMPSTASLFSLFVRPPVSLLLSPTCTSSPTLLPSALRKPMVVPYVRLSLLLSCLLRVRSLCLLVLLLSHDTSPVHRGGPRVLVLWSPHLFLSMSRLHSPPLALPSTSGLCTRLLVLLPIHASSFVCLVVI